MSVLVRLRRLDDIVIIDLSGRITAGEGTLAVREALQGAFQKNSAWLQHAMPGLQKDHCFQ